MFCNSFVGDDLYSNCRLNFWVKMAPILGGLRREYFTLAFKEFSFKYLEGRGGFQHNAAAYQVIAVDYVLAVYAHAALSMGLYSHCIIL